jgi:DUF4097 and DUF4098 domain-containing protein YvlB
MKLRVILLSFFLVAVSPAALLAHADAGKDKERSQKVERGTPADSNVTVSLCVMSGDVSVRSWDKNEVRARSSDAVRIELKRTDGAYQGPARKLEVLMLDPADSQSAARDCQAFGDIELMVPRNASVHVQTGDGSITFSEVASVYARTQTGDINVQKASRSVEAVSFSGGVTVGDSTGRITLKSVGGDVDASNLSPDSSDDSFEASTISGGINLDDVTYTQISVKTINGNLSLNGPLAHGGQYSFNTTTGDVTLAMPADSSFRLNARVSPDCDIITDFPLTLTIETVTRAGPVTAASVSAEAPSANEAPSAKAEPGPSAHPAAPAPPVAVNIDPKVKIKVKPVVVKAYTSRRVSAVHGTGDALINVASFSGTLRLQKLEE